jgi:hypothetical protein
LFCCMTADVVPVTINNLIITGRAIIIRIGGAS